MTTIPFDPYGEAHRHDPYPAYAELRRHSPVTQLPNGDYAVARYEDVSYVLRHPELFSSTAMLRAMTNVWSADAAAKLPPSDLARIAQMANRMPNLGEMIAARNMIASDPPVHGPMRNLVNRGFTPRRMAQLEMRVRDIARAWLAELERKPAFESCRTSCPVAGHRDRGAARRRARAQGGLQALVRLCHRGATGGAGALGIVDVMEGFTELSEYINGAVSRNDVRNPQDDLISTLLRAEEGETALPPTRS